MISAAACTSNVKSFDYSPCQYGRTSSYDNSIVCKSQLASEVLDAFRRNKDNAVIDNIYFQDIDDVTDEILEEILEVVIPSASNRVVEIMLLYLQNVTKVPRAIQQFTSLRTFGINFIEGLEILPSGSLTFSSNNLTELAFFGNPNLEVIEEGAFQGNFNDTNIVLMGNNLNKFDEAVFKPLLSDSTASIIVAGGPISCVSCSLAWIVRDNRQYLPRIYGICYELDGTSTDFQYVDYSILKDC